ncbi:unnamed protein product [Heligmosomoides polygyrus]|uniref:Lysosomal acid phosphatase n=1 Tax=Heligmosomoides polygyrus TaxID=6339 RepID=A0A3P7XSS6_HELPZ|nr:unnamed protein product [Heligmosomoides polygyrus]
MVTAPATTVACAMSSAAVVRVVAHDLLQTPGMPVKSAVFFQWLNTMGKETTSTVGQTTTKDGKKVPPPKKGMVKTLIGLVGTLLLLIMALIAYVVLFVYKPEPKVLKKTGLISTTVLFRHGARAPVDIKNDTMLQQFPNGPGEVTEIGLENTYKLGRFLGKRYVDGGFLRSPPLSKQLYFRSRSNNRCLICGGLVGSAMWSSDSDPHFTPIPLYAQEKNDMILTHRDNCALEKTRLSKKCGRDPPSMDNWSEYEGFVYECIGLDKETNLFKDKDDFARVEGLIQADQNGITMPKWFVDNRKEIYKIYNKLYDFIVGVNEFHQPAVLRLKQGVFMQTLLDNLQKQYDEYKDTGQVAKRKFTAYSTQDWLIMAFLEALGASTAALDGTMPQYNALIIVELSESEGGTGIVEVFYKANHEAELKDITSSVRGCSKSPCPLATFVGCCDDYKVKDSKQDCDAST